MLAAENVRFDFWSLNIELLMDLKEECKSVYLLIFLAKVTKLFSAMTL